MTFLHFFPRILSTSSAWLLPNFCQIFVSVEGAIDVNADAEVHADVEVIADAEVLAVDSEVLLIFL